MRVTLVMLVHSDSSVAKHGLRPRGRNRNEFVAADNGITNLPQLAGNFLMLNLEIGDCRYAPGTPVNDVLAAIDQTLLMQADEDLADRAREIFVHGEVFARPIDRCAKPLHLLLHVRDVGQRPLFGMDIGLKRGILGGKSE